MSSLPVAEIEILAREMTRLLDIPPAVDRAELIRLLQERRALTVKDLAAPWTLGSSASMLRVRAAAREELRVVEAALMEIGAPFEAAA
jgi:hypothetical protein